MKSKKAASASAEIGSFQNPSPIVLGLLLFLLAVITFLPILKDDFITLDDPLYVVGNVHVNRGITWDGLKWAFHGTDGGIWLPLTWLSHMLDCQLYGLKPWGHHLTSVLIHGMNTALVFIWLNRMTRTVWRSFVVAALFGLHPLRVESVAWVSEVKDVLSALFWLLTLLAYTEYVRKSQAEPSSAKKFYVLTLVFFVLGMMSKPMLVTLPFALLLLDWWPLNRLQNKKIQTLLIEKWPFFFLSILAGIVTFVIQKHEKGVAVMSRIPLMDRMENAVVSYVRYIGDLFWPKNLCIYYPYPAGHWPLGAVLAAAILLMILSIVCVWQWRRHPYLLVGWLWFLGTMIPVIGLVQTGWQAMADHYTYLPEIGLLIALVWSATALTQAWKRQSFILSIIAGIAIVSCTMLTYRQIGFWRNSEILFRHAIAVTGNNVASLVNLGIALDSAGHPQAALEQFQIALQDSPDDPDIYAPLALAFSHLGQMDKAIICYQKVLEAEPDNPLTRINLGNALLKNGQADEAIAQYEKALQLNPDMVEAHINLGNVLFQADHFDEAIVHFQKLLQINPADTESRINLGNALLKKDQIDEAIAQYQKVLENNPNNTVARINLGLALFQKGQIDEMISQFQQVISIEPNNAEIRHSLAATCNDLAWTLATSPNATIRNGGNAVKLALEANQLIGDGNPRALGTLAAAYAEAGRFPEAIQTAQRALQLASTQTDAALVHFLQIQIKLYQAGSPFHDESSTNAVAPPNHP